jgi:hypothetical protein
MPQPRSNEPKPLTEPADLLRLIGRFFATLILYIFALTYLFKQDMGGALILAIFALLMQFWTMSLWRNLRDQRIAAKATRDSCLASAATRREQSAEPSSPGSEAAG